MAKILSLFVILIALFEVLLTFFENSLSIDLVHVNSIKSVASEKNDIIILGNSLTREGIDQSSLRNSLANKINQKIKVGFIYPDDTSIIEWYYIFKYYFHDSQIYPKHLIINFGSDQLKSREFEFEEVQRIASYVSLNQLIEVSRQENLSFSESIDLYFSKIFQVYAHRERIAKRILDIIPNYRNTIREMNKSIQPSGYSGQNNSDYTHLKKMVKRADLLQIKTTFCAMPLPEKYQIPPDVDSIIDKSSKCQLVDLQNPEIFSISDFSDGYHLNTIGAQKYTRQLSTIIDVE